MHAHQAGVLCQPHLVCLIFQTVQVALLQDYARQVGVAGSKHTCIGAMPKLWPNHPVCILHPRMLHLSARMVIWYSQIGWMHLAETQLLAGL